MRPYRGWTIKDNKEVRGWYCENEGLHYIIPDTSSTFNARIDSEDLTSEHFVLEGLIEVHPDSVGQQTGCKDEDSKEIYGGDKLRESYGDTCIVYWKESTAGFYCKWRDGSDMPLDYGVAVDKCKIIGNIHDEAPKAP